MSGDTIELQMTLMFLWLPFYRRLSCFFQNGETPEERAEVLGSLIVLAKEMTEVIAGETHLSLLRQRQEHPDDPVLKIPTSEHIRMSQRKIADAVQNYIEPIAADLGFLFKKVAFSKCDYPPDIQKTLNAGIEARTIQGIANEMIAKGVSPDKAAELAAIYAGKNGITIKRDIFEIEVAEHVSKAVSNAGPALAAAAAAFVKSNKPPQGPKPGGQPPKKKGK